MSICIVSDEFGQLTCLSKLLLDIPRQAQSKSSPGKMKRNESFLWCIWGTLKKRKLYSDGWNYRAGSPRKRTISANKILHVGNLVADRKNWLFSNIPSLEPYAYLRFLFSKTFSLSHFKIKNPQGFHLGGSFKIYWRIIIWSSHTSD